MMLSTTTIMTSTSITKNNNNNNNNTTNQKRKKKTKQDPNGELKVARGVVESSALSKQRREELLASKSPLDQHRIKSFLQDQNAEARMKILKQDDAEPTTNFLSDHQQRALHKRKRDKIVQANLERQETKRLDAAVAAADAQLVLHTEMAGLIEPEHDMERTTRLSQTDLKYNYLEEQTAQHIYDLALSHHAPYGLKYDRSGSAAILYGRGGHVAMMNCQQRALKTEFYLRERVRDACFLHNTTLFATAQTNHVFIYDHAGVEIHKLDEHTDPTRLDFLPYHWLLVSIGRAGYLKYHDTSTGLLVSQHRTKLGPCDVMRQNPFNAVMHLGHKSGAVTLWSPASSKYMAKLLCHKGAPITALAVKDHVMVTGGADRQVRIWDLRMYKELHSYWTAAGIPTSLDISQRGVLGVGHAGHATFWSPEALCTKMKDPYMHHAMAGCSPVETLRFRPFEDVCGIGHGKGISSIVIPGSGEPNLDTNEFNTNPHTDKKQRQEAEVRSLLDKLSPDMISLDPDIVGGVEASDPHSRYERLKDLQAEANAKVIPKKKLKSKKRGRSKIQTQLRRKARNVVDENTIKLRDARDQEKAQHQRQFITNPGEHQQAPKDTAPVALKRFF
jgi:U3 small nucleolar RNA-associated protein 7